MQKDTCYFTQLAAASSGKKMHQQELRGGVIADETPPATPPSFRFKTPQNAEKYSIEIHVGELPCLFWTYLYQLVFLFSIHPLNYYTNQTVSFYKYGVRIYVYSTSRPHWAFPSYPGNGGVHPGCRSPKVVPGYQR